MTHPACMFIESEADVFEGKWQLVMQVHIQHPTSYTMLANEWLYNMPIWADASQ